MSGVRGARGRMTGQEGSMVAALVMIKAETDKVTQLAEALTETTGVSEVFSVAGQWDLVAIVRTRDNETLAEVVTDRIRKLPGITGSETMIAFRSYSRRELEAGFALGVDD
jgi:DNA-binding Lrp family transcriptional regulator